jgi:hypothetical protein
MAWVKRLARKTVMDSKARELFLAKLAETSNVTASAKAADIEPWVAYRARRQSAPFRAQWHQALCEGFVRLEAELLAEALRAPSAKASEATLKARAGKVRLGLSLLNLHRASVRGEKTDEAKIASATSDRRPKAIQARIEARFADMREATQHGSAIGD